MKRSPLSKPDKSASSPPFFCLMALPLCGTYYLPAPLVLPRFQEACVLSVSSAQAKPRPWKKTSDPPSML